MKKRTRLSIIKTPEGGEMELIQHDRDFYIRINGQDLMQSRRHESELALARRGCSHLADEEAPEILIGGLGMGYTLRQTLDLLGPGAKITVSELLEDVVSWNRNFLGGLNNHPISDPRVEVKTGDVIQLILNSRNRFDSILLDIDNGPGAVTAAANSRLYSYDGIISCRRALREGGCLAIWSARPSREFEKILKACGLLLRRFKEAAHRGSKQSHIIWLASR